MHWQGRGSEELELHVLSSVKKLTFREENVHSF